MGPGLGKSHIAVYVGALMNYSKTVNEVLMVYSDQKIMDSEKAVRKAIASFCRGIVQADLIKNMSELRLKKSLLVIIDEGDSWSFGDALDEDLPTIKGNGPLLCLSATGIKLGSEMERKYLAEE